MIVRVDHLVPIEMNCGEVLDWDESWSIVILTDSKEYRTFCSKDSRGAYTLRISREMVDWKMAVGDFISYAKANQKNAILVMKDEELKEAKRYYDGHAFNEVYLRIGEPEILVHSTTLENWSMICCDGCLLSWNAIRYAGRGLEKEPIGKLLGDPEDFRDYIMFAQEWHANV